MSDLERTLKEQMPSRAWPRRHLMAVSIGALALAAWAVWRDFEHWWVLVPPCALAAWSATVHSNNKSLDLNRIVDTLARLIPGGRP